MIRAYFNLTDLHLVGSPHKKLPRQNRMAFCQCGLNSGKKKLCVTYTKINEGLLKIQLSHLRGTVLIISPQNKLAEKCFAKSWQDKKV